MPALRNAWQIQTDAVTIPRRKKTAGKRRAGFVRAYAPQGLRFLDLGLPSCGLCRKPNRNRRGTDITYIIQNYLLNPLSVANEFYLMQGIGIQ